MSIMRKKCLLYRSLSFQYQYGSNDITSRIYAITIIICFILWIFRKEMYVDYCI